MGGKNPDSKTSEGVLSLPVCFKKTAIFFKSEKDFSNNHCFNSPVADQHNPDTGILDQEYDRCGKKAV